MSFRDAPRRTSPAFTLVEMMIAVVITALIMTMLWELFGSGSRAAAYGTWYSSRVQELRTTLRMIREDLAKATYPSVMDPAGHPKVKVTDSDATFYIGRHDGKTTFPTTADLLQYHICRPDMTKMPENVPPADLLVTLKAAGTIVKYTRKGQSGSYGPEDEYNPDGLKDTIHDVDFVEITLNPNKPGDADGSQATGDSTGTLTVKIHCTFPFDKNKGAEETTNCKLNIKYKTL